MARIPDPMLVPIISETAPAILPLFSGSFVTLNPAFMDSSILSLARTLIIDLFLLIMPTGFCHSCNLKGEHLQPLPEERKYEIKQEIMTENSNIAKEYERASVHTDHVKRKHYKQNNSRDEDTGMLS